LDRTDEIIQALRQANLWQEASIAIGAARTLIEAAPPGGAHASLINALSDAAARIFVSPDKTLGREALSLGPIFWRAQCLPANLGTWHTYAQRLQAMLLELPADSSALSPLLRLLVAEGVALGPSSALARFIVRMATMDAGLLRQFFDSPDDVANTLCAAGWFETPTDELARTLLGAVDTICQQDVVSVRNRTVRMLTLMGFSSAPSVPWVTMLMDYFLYPVMERPSEELGRIDLTLILESLSYHFYVKKVENAVHFKNAYLRLKQPLIRDGSFLRSRLSPFPKANHTIPRIGFFLPSAALLAHTQNLVTFLRGLGCLTPKVIEPVVYVLGPRMPPLDNVLRPLDIKVVYLWEAQELLPIDSYVSLRTEAVTDGIAAMVFVSNVTGMSFLTAMGVAPVHIWWSMKYRGLKLPNLDGYMDMSQLFEQKRTLDGVTWFGCHAALPPLTNPKAAPVAAQMRVDSRLMDGTIVLGCIGREEKLLNRAYAAALAEIMRRCPNTEYIWSGRAQPPEFVAWLKEEGIDDRCTFIGWVDTKLYAQVLDIFVDSFPFASGHTAYEAMAVGKPIVVLLTPEAMETSTASAVMPAFEGRAGTPADQNRVREIFTAADGSTLLPFVSDVESYIDQTQRLVNDADFRAAVGNAGKVFVEEYMRDEARLAKSTCQNILDIINQAQAK